MKIKIVVVVLLFLGLLQFYRIDRATPELVSKEDFIVSNSAPQDVAKILKVSCYDCHSYETTYPLYAQLAPISIFLDNHIKDGRKHLNFSTWSQYPDKKKNHKLKECIEMIEENEMPMSSYTLIHRDATLNAEQKALLVDWIRSISIVDSAAH